MKNLDNFNPYLIFTASRKELKELLLKTGGWIFYDGVCWDIKTKNLGAGVYNIWCEKRK